MPSAPPSTANGVPVANAASSLSRYATVFASSAGGTYRPSGSDLRRAGVAVRREGVCALKGLRPGLGVTASSARTPVARREAFGWHDLPACPDDRLASRRATGF